MDILLNYQKFLETFLLEAKDLREYEYEICLDNTKIILTKETYKDTTKGTIITEFDEDKIFKLSTSNNQLSHLESNTLNLTENSQIIEELTTESQIKRLREAIEEELSQKMNYQYVSLENSEDFVYLINEMSYSLADTLLSKYDKNFEKISGYKKEEFNSSIEKTFCKNNYRIETKTYLFNEPQTYIEVFELDELLLEINIKVKDFNIYQNIEVKNLEEFLRVDKEELFNIINEQIFYYIKEIEGI